jgi:hypothetical protein
MSTSGTGSRGPQSRDRMLDASGFLFHYRHTENGYERTKGCRFCAGGLERISTEIKVSDGVVGAGEVDEGGRVDGAGATASASGGDQRAWWET